MSFPLSPYFQSLGKTDLRTSKINSVSEFLLLDCKIFCFGLWSSFHTLKEPNFCRSYRLYFRCFNYFSRVFLPNPQITDFLTVWITQFIKISFLALENPRSSMVLLTPLDYFRNNRDKDSLDLKYKWLIQLKMLFFPERFCY